MDGMVIILDEAFCCWSMIWFASHIQLKDLKGREHEDTTENILIHQSKKQVLPDHPMDSQRREKVKEAMVHAWSSYVKYAWGQDELQVHFQPDIVSITSCNL